VSQSTLFDVNGTCFILTLFTRPTPLSRQWELRKKPISAVRDFGVPTYPFPPPCTRTTTTHTCTGATLAGIATAPAIMSSDSSSMSGVGGVGDTGTNYKSFLHLIFGTDLGRSHEAEHQGKEHVLAQFKGITTNYNERDMMPPFLIQKQQQEQEQGKDRYVDISPLPYLELQSSFARRFYFLTFRSLPAFATPRPRPRPPPTNTNTNTEVVAPSLMEVC